MDGEETSQPENENEKIKQCYAEKDVTECLFVQDTFRPNGTNALGDDPQRDGSECKIMTRTSLVEDNKEIF